MATMAESEIIFSVEESPEGDMKRGALGHAIRRSSRKLSKTSKAMVRDAGRLPLR